MQNAGTETTRVTHEKTRVSLCTRAVECAGQIFTPDQTTAFVVFQLAHAFPVVTSDNTALHPQVVSNSYRSMQWKVFDLAHLIRSYDPKATPTDRILGTVVAVEFPERPEGGWQAQAERSKAPGIRAVACMHKQAYQVKEILEKYFTGEMEWTVSMENAYRIHTCGFGIRGGRMTDQIRDWMETTPDDLRALDWTYVAAEDAPMEMLEGLAEIEKKPMPRWQGYETVAFLGGLDGTIHFQGVGLTPAGKEPEACVEQMLASEKLMEINGKLMPDIFETLKRTATMIIPK